MPMYEYLCADCERRLVLFRKIDDRDNAPICLDDRRPYQRIISAPMISPDLSEPYESPKTGKWITSRAERDEDLRRSGSILLEPGLKKDIARNYQENLDKAFAPIAAAVDAKVTSMVAERKLET